MKKNVGKSISQHRRLRAHRVALRSLGLALPLAILAGGTAPLAQAAQVTQLAGNAGTYVSAPLAAPSALNGTPAGTLVELVIEIKNPVGSDPDDDSDASIIYGCKGDYPLEIQVVDATTGSRLAKVSGYAYDSRSGALWESKSIDCISTAFQLKSNTADSFLITAVPGWKLSVPGFETITDTVVFIRQ